MSDEELLDIAEGNLQALAGQTLENEKIMAVTNLAMAASLLVIARNSAKVDDILQNTGDIAVDLDVLRSRSDRD